MVHTIWFQKLKQNNNSTETSFQLQLNQYGLSMLYILLIQAFNAIGILLSNNQSIHNCNGYEGECVALQQTRFIPKSYSLRIDYPPPSFLQKFMHYHVWPIFEDAIIWLPMQFGSSYLAQLPSEKCGLVKPYLSLARHLVCLQLQIDNCNFSHAFT